VVSKQVLKPRRIPNKKGKPFEITPDLKHQVESLAAMGASNESIADFLGMDNDTLVKHFSDVLKNGKSRVCNRLRMMQLKKAYQGNTGMLIWMGKQLLGQSEKKTLMVEDADGFEFDFKDSE
jgi:hypothetical protein